MLKRIGKAKGTLIDPSGVTHSHMNGGHLVVFFLGGGQAVYTGDEATEVLALLEPSAQAGSEASAEQPQQ